MTKMKLMTGASALVVASMAFTGASATTAIYSGGSSLISPYANQAENCFGGPSQVLDVQGSLSGSPVPPTTQASIPLACVGSTAATKSVFNYDSVGSGNGIASLVTQSPATYAGVVLNTPQPDGPEAVYPAWEFAGSDAALALGDVSIYVNGGVLANFKKAPLDSAGCTAAANADPASPYFGCHVAGNFPNPNSSYGPLIQIPALIAPVAIAYNPTYYSAWTVTNGKGKLTNYAFKIKTPLKATLNGGISETVGGLLLDMPTVCSIFNGQITAWSDPALTALNGGVSLASASDKGGAVFNNLLIEMVGRQDGSGTTSIFNRALAAQCNSTVQPTYTPPAGFPNGFYNQAGATTLPSSLIGQTWVVGNTPPSPIAGKFTVVALSQGIQDYLAIAPNTATTVSNTVIQGKLAYIGPDFVLPAVTYTDNEGPLSATKGTSNYYLNTPIADQLNEAGIKGMVATIKSGKTTFKAGALLPNAQNALIAFQGDLPPQTGADGSYQAGSTANGLRNAPSDWAQSTATTETLSNSGGVAIPTPLAYAINIEGAYPMVGTSNFDFVTCYATSATATTIANFIDYYEGGTPIAGGPNGVVIGQALVNAGLSPLPAAWNSAIISAFAKGTDGLGLNVSSPAAASPTAACVGSADGIIGAQ
jgi:ABC-type phosphate transport system substrate-binding protein